jgi:peptidoglycan/LPS O-acetylase OafA/YrhL
MIEHSRTGLSLGGHQERNSGLVQSAPKHRFGVLDDCRGIAVILVFLRHCENFLPASVSDTLYNPWKLLSELFSGKVDVRALVSFIAFFPFHLGWSALPIFFVISGFCIHLTYCQPASRDLRAFYVRRFFRIYPAYLLALLFFGLFFPLTRLPLNKLTYWGQLVTHLFLCHNVSELSVCAIVPAYWTIAVEVQLYLLFPLLLVFARRLSLGRVLLVLAIIEVSLHTVAAIFFEKPGSFAPVWLRTSPFFFCFSWGIGAAIADAYLAGRPLPFTRIHPAVWLVPWFLTCTWPASEFSFTFFALFTASAISRRLERGPGHEPRTYFGRFVRQTGIYSYSIYLIHTPILRAVVSLYQARFPGIENHPFLIFGAAASGWLLVFPLGALMYYSVEKPGIYIGKRLLRLWGQRPAGHPVAEAAPAG